MTLFGSGRRKRPRVLLGTMEVSGYLANLLEGLREVGADVVFASLVAHPFRYREDPAEPRLIRWTRVAATRRRAASSAAHRLRTVGWLGAEAVLRAMLLCWAVARFDVFIFGYGSSILGVSRIEYPLLRLLRRRLICVFLGSDTRPPYMDGTLMPAGEPGLTGRCIALTRSSKARARIADRYADWVVTNPASAHFHERPAVSGYCIGLPTRPVAAPPIQRSRGEGGPLRLLHSPSVPTVKGTREIVQAVESLRSRGHDLELVLITGRPNSEVLEELATCDLVIDQVYCDTPMAGLASEAASFGKAAVVGGYAEAVFERLIPAGSRAPSAYCRPEDLEATIERLAVDPAHRARLGRDAKAFVERQWTPAKVAERYMRLIEGDVPREWLFDPSEVVYLHGHGFPEHRVREIVRDVIAMGGVEALQVSDKPALERALVEFAAQGDPADPARAASAALPRGGSHSVGAQRAGQEPASLPNSAS